jgi:hypothetical protein
VSRRAIFSVVLFILAVVCTTTGATAAPTGAKPAQRPARPGMTSFVWTNDEIDMLRQGNVPVSTVGGQSGQTPPVVIAAPSELASYDRTKDPDWYAGQAAILRAEIDARQADLTKQQAALADARNERQTDPGVDMDRGNAGVTPEAGVEVLEARVQEAQGELDALADLARQNGIPPAALRG